MTRRHLRLVDDTTNHQGDRNIMNTPYTITITNKFFDSDVVEEVELPSMEAAVDFAVETTGSSFAVDIEVVDRRGGSASLSLDRLGGDLVETDVLLRRTDSGEFVVVSTEADSARVAVESALALVPAADVVALEAGGITEWWQSPPPSWDLPTGWVYPRSAPRPALRVIDGGAA